MELSAKEWLNLISGVLTVLAYVPYIYAIYKGDGKPALSTWIIWFTVNTLIGAGMYEQGTLNAQIVIISLGDLYIIYLAYRYGEYKWSHLDSFCLAGATMGLLAWIDANDPDAAIISGLAMVVIGSIPTVVKTWKRPEQEDWKAYIVMLASSTLQIAAVTSWTIAEAAQPLVYFAVGAAILPLILLRPRSV